MKWSPNDVIVAWKCRQRAELLTDAGIEVRVRVRAKVRVMVRVRVRLLTDDRVEIGEFVNIIQGRKTIGPNHGIKLIVELILDLQCWGWG